MIQHIFSDMDGTLLNSTGVISDNNANLIRQCGIPFTLVSARAPMEMSPVIQKLQLTQPQIAFNGGLIFTEDAHQHRQIIRQTHLDWQVTEKLLTEITTNFPQVSTSFYDLDHWYTEQIDEGIRYEQKLTGQAPTLINVSEFFQQVPVPLFKIMLITFDPAEMAALKSFAEQLNLPGIAIQQSGAAYLEITSDQAKKSAGLHYIFETEQLTKETTAAFGDGHNDLPMLEMVGYPIVMANGQAEVKVLAYYITKSNDEDGVGYGIEQVLLKL